MFQDITAIFRKTDIEDYLEAAIQTAEYIRKHKISTPEGSYFQISGTEGKVPDSVETSFLSERSLYAGSAGIGYFFLQLYEVTGEKEWLEKAIEAGEYLLHTYRKESSMNPGFHTGTSGEGALLLLLYEKTKEKKYLEHAIRIADDIYEVAAKDEKGIHWDGYSDFMGDGGAIIFWLLVAEKTGDYQYIHYAGEVLDSILTLGVSADNDSLYWKLFDPHVYFKTVPAGGIVPNFAHGTAGIIYLLVKYYEVTKKKSYLDAAVKGYRFLKKIAIQEGDAAIVPYIYLEEEKRAYDILYLGYCHGPVGDGIAILELYKATGNQEYKDFYDQLTNALIQAGVPRKRSAGYWNDCLCCGSAGVLLHFLKAGESQEKYLAYARETADKTVADAYKDQEGYRWYNAWTRIKPWDVDPHLGLYVGAAGSGSALLSLYGKLKNLPVTPLYEYR